MEHLSIYFVTWNVATRSPEQELHQLLGISHHGPNASKPLPDLFFIGLQEVKSQPQNIVLDMIFEDPWTKAFREVLKEHGYIKIRTQRLQGLVLNFFCRTKHFTRLRSIEAQYTKTGFGGMWGNKGAVSVRFNIYGVNICVVNTHLTPHDHLLADRISDYNTILRQHSFNADDTSSIFFHDYVFWIGDLNFRLNAEDLDAASISMLVTKNQLNELLKRDQLKQVRESGEAFSELIENEITFPPTYKYEFTSQEFDLKRKPSWTDRILYKVNSLVYEGVELKAVQKNYNSHASYVQSDHKPVTGEFNIVVRSEFDSHGVEFEPISQWFINEQNSVCYRLIGDAEPAEGDWVGLYQNNFSSLDEYLVYEYIFRGKTTLDSTTAVEPLTSSSASSSREVILFSDTALRSPGMYQLVYVTQKGDLVGVLGVSAPFPGHHRNI